MRACGLDILLAVVQTSRKRASTAATAHPAGPLDAQLDKLSEADVWHRLVRLMEAAKQKQGQHKLLCSTSYTPAVGCCPQPASAVWHKLMHMHGMLIRFAQGTLIREVPCHFLVVHLVGSVQHGNDCSRMPHSAPKLQHSWTKPVSCLHLCFLTERPLLLLSFLSLQVVRHALCVSRSIFIICV